MQRDGVCKAEQILAVYDADSRNVKYVAVVVKLAGATGRCDSLETYRPV